MVLAEVIGMLFIIVLIGTIVSLPQLRHAFKTNFALSNKSLVLLSTDLFKEAWYPFLNMYFPFFQNLNEKGKERFRVRLIQNLRDLDIIGKEGLDVNDEMRILLCATLTQLTFGFKRQGLRGYKMIHVYPTKFYNKKYNGYIESVTYKSHLIAISWIDYERGLLNNEDGKNLGLNEFAYALLHTVKNGEQFDLKFASYLENWMRIIKESKHKAAFLNHIHVSESHIDADHVFPLAVSVFFEKPFDFKQQYPSIYAHLCVLLNQNPLNVTNNYTLENNAFKNLVINPPLPAKIEINYLQRTWHWSYNLLIFTPIIFPFIALYFIMYYHIINTNELIIYILATAGLLTLLTNKLNQKHQLFGSPLKLFGFNVFAIGPLLFSFILLLNGIISIGNPTTEIHKINETRGIYQHLDTEDKSLIADFEFDFFDGFLADYPYARQVNAVKVRSDYFKNAFVHFEIQRGILGFKHITNKQVIYNNQNSTNF
jgi:Mlc titration factor MtfA (ptsG expression regulator)